MVRIFENTDENYIYVLAEIGINHDGDIKIAKDLIHACKKAGADGVKFQLIHPETLVNDFVFEEDEVKKNPAVDIFEKYSLKENDYAELAEYAAKEKIDFLCTCFDTKAIDFIDPHVKAHKISSGDITNIPLLKHAGSKNKPVIISTGMADIHTVRQAINAVKDGGGKQITLLHCTSLYPPRDDEVNLKAIQTLKQEFALPVGFSDHTLGNTAAIGACALGARFIEKHVTFNKNAKGADHAMSMEIDDFEEMIRKIRRVSNLLGTGDKKPCEREKDVASAAFRGLYAKTDIKKGDTFNEDNVKIVRPSSYLKPIDFYNIKGKTALNDIKESYPITHGDF
jgi:N,N'-diacetyllegionaminate synthase